MPIKMAKQTLSRNPRFHPRPTRHAVAAARINVIDRAENKVKRSDFDETITTAVENPIAIALALRALLSIWLVVSFLC